MSRNITFQSQNIDFSLKHKQATRLWIQSVIAKKGYSVGPLNYLFVSDEELLNMNKQYLNHDYYTDIITFDYTENKRVSGDIFISVDRVADNAKKFNTTFDEELRRVIIHGVLHLMGQKDKSKADAEAMRKAEDGALKLFAPSLRGA